MNDYFLVTAFVFCALLEFTLVNYMWRKKPKDPVSIMGMAQRGAGAGADNCKNYKGNQGEGSETITSINLAVSKRFFLHTSKIGGLRAKVS